MHTLKRMMNLVLLMPLSLVLFSCSAPNTDEAATSTTSSGPDIKGTYELVSRQLPDGTLLKPPAVAGLYTYTETRRNFNIVEEDAMGKNFVSMAASYTFTPTEYTQTRIFRTTTDASDRSKVVYDGPGETLTSEVKIEGGRIEFKLPGDEPTLVFEGTTMTATEPGSFIDVWEKVP